MIVFGDSSSGKTSLAYVAQYQLNLLDFIPIYIHASQIKKYDEDKLENLVRRNYEKQYYEPHKSIFEQLNRLHMVIIIDDFEKLPFNTEKKSILPESVALILPF